MAKYGAILAQGKLQILNFLSLSYYRGDLTGQFSYLLLFLLFVK